MSGALRVFRHDGKENNNPLKMPQILMYEGDDKYDDLVEFGATVLAELRQLEKDGLKLADGTHVKIIALEGM